MEKNALLLGNDIDTMENIATVLAVLYSQVSASDKEIAKQIGVSQKEFNRVYTQNNSEIDFDLLFKLYYLGDIIAHTSSIDLHKLKFAELLKERCDEEIVVRISTQ